MQILVRVDAQEALESLEELGLSKKGPRILANTLNELAKKVQTAEQLDLANSLKIKRTTFIHNAVKISSGTWANATRLMVTINVIPPQGAAADRLDFLGDLEQGAEHVPAFGHSNLALPNRQVFGDLILRDTNPLRPKNLELTDHKGDVAGKQRTFLIKSQRGVPMILQRTSSLKAKRSRGNVSSMRSKTGTRVLFELIKSSQRPAKIHWASVADATVQGEAQGCWLAVVKEAFDHLNNKS